jgi:RNA polymerase sigma-70 factor (ECF subfamily)
LTTEDNPAFVNEILQEHGQRLRSFLARRLQHAAADLPDLVQEVYLRLLRVPSAQTIRSPQAYLFTVAMHVLHQHRLNLASSPESVDIADALPSLRARDGDNPAEQVEAWDRLEEFDRVLSQLPRQTYAVFILHRQYGYSREEIADRLGLSYAMVKKHLAQALVHCRLRLDGAIG